MFADAWLADNPPLRGLAVGASPKKHHDDACFSPPISAPVHARRDRRRDGGGHWQRQSGLSPWLEIDARREVFVDSPQDDALLRRTCRKPFVVPGEDAV